VYVGLLKLRLAIADSHSLKDKRMVLRRIKDRVRDRLHVIVNEVGQLDTWQRAELGCAVVSADRAHALELVDEVVRVAVAAGGASVVAIAKDAITFADEPQPIAAIDERTGSGDKAQGAAGDEWIPDAWREEAER
jgi:uncharacterized protein YlxP (DUF503 family)